MHDPIHSYVEEHFGGQLRAAEKLRDFAKQRLLSGWPGRAPESVVDHLLLVFLARSYDTFAASVSLLRNGWGAQASMLNRSLFEDMVDAHWIVSNPGAAQQRFEDHHLHARMLLADAVAKYPAFYKALQLPEFDPAERRRLDEAFGRYGTRSWTTVDLHSRVEQIAEHWPDEAGQLQLRFFRDIAHRENNQILHVTATGLQSAVDVKGDRLSFKVGPRDDMLDRAIFGAFWIFDQTIGMVLERFGIDVSEREMLETFSLRAFVTLTPEQMRATGRNEKCPCGSGLKFKRCHGA